MKFQDDQVRTLKTHHQPAAVAPIVVISNPFNEPHAPTDTTVQPSHVRNSAHAAQQLGIVSHIHIYVNTKGVKLVLEVVSVWPVERYISVPVDIGVPFRIYR